MSDKDVTRAQVDSREKTGHKERSRTTDQDILQTPPGPNTKTTSATF